VRITVLGATGRTGGLLVALAGERGHEVTAFVRAGSSNVPTGVKVVPLALADPTKVEAALTEAQPEAVVSAIGPIAGLSEHEVSETMAAVVEAMQHVGPSRLVIASNSAAFSQDATSGPFANVTAAHRRNLEILRASSLDWTALAPTLLRDDGDSGSFVAKVEARPPGPSMARADLALALLEATDRPDWIGRAVGVSS
jgi:putative NADH-flavin reductase